MADPLKERISLLQMGEAQGKLRPEHKAELEEYRRKGLIKPPAGMFGGGKDAKTQSGKAKAARGLLDQLGRVEQLYDQDFKGVGPGSLMEYLPTSRSKRFNDAANALMPYVKSLARTPGEGAQSDRDAQDYRQLLPQNNAYDAQNEERIAALRAMAERELGTGQSGWKVRVK